MSGQPSSIAVDKVDESWNGDGVGKASASRKTRAFCCKRSWLLKGVSCCSVMPRAFSTIPLVLNAAARSRREIRRGYDWPLHHKLCCRLLLCVLNLDVKVLKCLRDCSNEVDQSSIGVG